jgi:hypothetical protein
MSAGYSIPWTATSPPIIAPMADTKGGPATEPMLPSSVVPRAKRTVMALQPPPPTTSFWTGLVSAAMVSVGRRAKVKDFIMIFGRDDYIIKRYKVLNRDGTSLGIDETKK